MYQPTWRKSTRSTGNGNCVEKADPPAVWRKSKRSSESAYCVEVAEGACQHHLVRDSKDPDGPWLHFGRSAWGTFIAGVKAGEFDR